MPTKSRQRKRVTTPAVEESAVAELQDPEDVVCPKSAAHGPGRFYHAEGSAGLFTCDACGHCWTAPVRYLESLTDFCLLLAESLEKAPTQKADDGTSVIVWEEGDAKEAARVLRRLATQDPRSVSPGDMRKHRLRHRRPPLRPPTPSLAAGTIDERPGSILPFFKRLIRGSR